MRVAAGVGGEAFTADCEGPDGGGVEGRTMAGAGVWGLSGSVEGVEENYD